MEHHQAGRLDQAEILYRKMLAAHPDSAKAHDNLGLVLQQQGRFEEAIRHLERVVELEPLTATPYVNLGRLLHGQGKIVEALAIFREGARLVPQSAHVHSHLGRMLLELAVRAPERAGYLSDALAHCQEAVKLLKDAERLCDLAKALLALGRNGEAEACCRAASELDARWPAAYHLLGQSAQQQGRSAEAVDWYRQAVGLDPGSLELLRDLGSALYANGQTEEAIARYRLVTKLYPENAEAFNGLGYLLQDQGDTAGAVAAYREAIRVKPDYADAFLNLGLALAELGEMDEAQQAYRQAIARQPQHAESYAALALSLRDKLPDLDLAVIQDLLGSHKVTGKKRAVLQFGVVQTLDARNQFSLAADQLCQANAYFKEEYGRRGQLFDPREHEAYVEQILAAYSPEHFQRTHGWGLDSDVPVFVLGLPRSGTSLIEQILASHPQAHGAGELNLMRDCYRAIPRLVGKDAPGIECVGDLTRNMVEELARKYLDGLRALHPAAERIVDKMPDNYLMLGLIATLLPRARIIHTRRDLRDVALSCWMTFFKHIKWAFDLDHIGVRIREYVRLMEHWRKVLPVPILEVDYEETVANLEGVARKLVAWCGLEWHPACLEFHKTKRPVRTASMLQVREPVHSRSVGRWRNYQEFLAPLEKYLGSSGKVCENTAKNL